VHVVVDWTTTPDVIAGRCTSCVSVLLLTGLWLLERKLNRPRYHESDALEVKLQEQDVKSLNKQAAELTDRALEELLPSVETVPSSIHGAMRHSTFAGGKRLRPLLCYQAAVTIAGALPAGIENLGAAIEMLHTYSLIHDDLRPWTTTTCGRGKPTCHVVFGEAIAILAGDALQTRAFEVLANLASPPAATVQILRLVANAVGTVEGMIGGQVLDIENEHAKPTAELVDAIHRAKTGALIRVSVVAGGVYAGATADDIARLDVFDARLDSPSRLPTTFSDMTEDSAALGKTRARIWRQKKSPGRPSWNRAEPARRRPLIEEAFAALEPYGDRADGLKAVAATWLNGKTEKRKN